MSRSRSGAGLTVAETKRRFSELIDRVQRGERFLVTRRGKPALVLAPPLRGFPDEERPPPAGLAAIAGALAEVDLDALVQEIYAARRRARDRPSPDLG
jgi:antitoxin (DNA-binding transcriptional repressor) of toxin-antitoxin stability system